MADPAPAPTEQAAPPPGFDLAGARAAGYGDQQIAEFLAPKLGFDLAGARSAGFGNDQIVQSLVSRAAQPPPAAAPDPNQQTLDPTFGGTTAPSDTTSGLGRTISAVGNGVAQGFGTDPIGMGPETEGALRNIGVFPPSSSLSDALQNPLRALNEAVMKPAAALGDAFFRATSAGFAGAQAGAAQGLAEVGAPQLGQDVAGFAEAFAPELMGGHSSLSPVNGARIPAEVSAAFRDAGVGRGGRPIPAPAEPVAPPALPASPTAGDIIGGAADILTAPTINDGMRAAAELAQRQTPIDVNKVAGELDTGEPADQHQAKLLRMFDGLGSGVVENDGSGGYQFRTPGPDGEEVTHPITPWNPDAGPAPDGQPTIPADTAHAISDHYAAAGVNTVFYHDDPAMKFEGTFDPQQPDTIFVSNNPGRAVAQVAGHEFTHALADTTLPDGTNVGDLLNQQIAAGITPEGQRYAKAAFGDTAPQRSSFPEGEEGDAAHRGAVQAHLVNELGADIGAEAPKFQTFLPKVVDAIQARFGNTVAGDVLSKLIGGLRNALDTVRGLFPDTTTLSQNWVTNIADIHDTLAKMYAERFGSPAERLQAQTDAVRDRIARDTFTAEPQAAPTAPPLNEGVAAERARLGLPPMAEPVAEAGKAGNSPETELPAFPDSYRPPPAEPAAPDVLTLRRWAGELSDEQKTAAANTPQAALLHQTEAAILRPVGGDETALPPPQAARLEAVRSQLDAVTNPPDSAALARVKAELAEASAEQARRFEESATGAEPGAGQLPPDAMAPRARGKVTPYTKVPKEPERLTNFLIRHGGLSDVGGDVRHIAGAAKQRPGLLNSNGMLHDDAALFAHENGYFPEHGENRPSINDLLEKLDEDQNRYRPQYSHYDQIAAENYHAAIARNDEIDSLAAEYGIPTRGLTHAEFFDQLADRLSQNEMADEQARVGDEHEAAYSEAEHATQDWVVYHGTPHDFDQFDIGKIGTGEGAQAYGHGLYLAENPAIGAGYRDQLSRTTQSGQSTNQFRIDGKLTELGEFTDRSALNAAAKGNLPAYIQQWEAWPRDHPHPDAAALADRRLSEARALDGKQVELVPHQGNLLTVRLRAKPEEMLDWDKPLSEQNPEIQEALKNIAGPEATGREVYGLLTRLVADEHFDKVQAGADPQRLASEALHDAGIKGIRYLDGNSRGAGEGSRNVVVFDHNDLDITHRNGVAVKPKEWNPDQFYGSDQARSLEDLENEHRQEDAALAAQQRDSGTEPPGLAGPHPGDVEEGGGPVRGGAGVAGRDDAQGPARDLLGRPITETTRRAPDPTLRNDPNQSLMPGMERSAVQAQAARDQAGRGGLGPNGEVKPADEGLFAPKEPDNGALFSPRFPGERPGASAAAAEDAPQLGRHDSDVSDLMNAVVSERGGIMEAGKPPTLEEQDLAEIARLGTDRIKNVNAIEQEAMFARTLAANDTRSGNFYDVFMARETEGNGNLHDLRSVIDESRRKLDDASRKRVYGAQELARLLNWRPKDSGALIEVHNPFFELAEHTKVGETYVLTAAETRYFHDLMKLGDAGWKMYADALVRREGWRGPVDPAAIEAAARDQAGLPDGKKWKRLAAGLREIQKQGARPYFPAMRPGNVVIALTQKLGPELDTISVAKGRPELLWLRTVERKPLSDMLGRAKETPDEMSEVQAEISAIGKRPGANGEPMFGEFKNTSPGVWESETHRIETGDWEKTPDILRSLNVPAIEKLFMMMERHATDEMIEKVLGERLPEAEEMPGRQHSLEDGATLSTKEARALRQRTAQYGGNFNVIGGEARESYQATLGATKDTFLDMLYDHLLAGWKKQAKIVPGYSPDFDRAIGTHMGQVARNAADMAHRNEIDRTFQDVAGRSDDKGKWSGGHPNESVAKYWRAFQLDQNNPSSPWSRRAGSAGQIGTAFAMALNPSSTLKMFMHNVMMGAPVMSVGVGMGKASAELMRATAEVYRHATFDMDRGASIDATSLGKTDGERAFIAGVERIGLTHAKGFEDIAQLNDGVAGLWGKAGPVMRKALELSLSNIAMVDRANRLTVALAAYRIGQNQSALMLATRPLMRDNALFRAAVDRLTEEKMTAALGTNQDIAVAQAAALREAYPRFMIDQAGGQWGKSNQAAAMRGIEGAMYLKFRGFQTRYLSTAINLMKNSGPEGKVAAAWMMAGLFIVGGTTAMPFVGDAENAIEGVWKWLGHEDPLIATHVRQWMGDAGFPQIGAKILLHGMGSVLSGTDASSSMGFGTLLTGPASLADLFGVVPSMMFDRMSAGYNRYTHGQGAAAAASELLPSALRNPAQSYFQSQIGVMSPTSKMILPADRITKGDTIRKALGFTPMDVTNAREHAEADYALTHHDEGLRQDVVQSYAVLSLRASKADRIGDHAGADALRAEASRIITANPGLMVTQQAIKNAEMQMMDPEKYRLMQAPMRVKKQMIDQSSLYQ